MQNRAGQYKTNLSGEAAYDSFLPSPLPPNPELNIDETILQLLVKANRSLAKLDEISARIPDISLFISAYIRKEALLSSQIEGTQATLDDIFDPDIEANTNQNVAEVINYINAINYALNRLETFPLCNRFLLEAYKILMQDARGQDKNPGEFRTSQNWIGAGASTIKTARFIPPAPQDMIAAMSDLEKFINAEHKIDPLIKIAYIHYQFETIHPFLDGNGRIGRLMINLLLKQNNLLKYPVLYVSYFMKRNRIEYYDRLTEVREKGNYEQWVKFFLQAIEESSQDAIQTIDLLITLHEKNIAKINSFGKSSKTLNRVFGYIEKNPIIGIKRTASNLSITYNTVSKAVNSLVQLTILVKVENKSRNRNFAYEEYLKILRKDT